MPVSSRSLLYRDGEGPATDVRSIAVTPPEPGRNLLNPHIPGTRANTALLNRQIEDMPWPSLRGSSESLMGAAGLLPAAFTVYHGTPHKFDKFDVSKIGTGQGAQSYGHGLYFAENQGVAKHYWEGLQPTDRTGFVYKGQAGGSQPIRADQYGIPENLIDSVMEPGETASMAEIQRRVSEKFGPKDPDVAPFLYWATNGEGKGITQVKKNKIQGGLLKADIHPSPDKFLDWDKPLSEQGKEYKDVLGGIVNKVKKSFPGFREDATVGDLYNAYTSHRGGNAAAVSEELSKLGIPGIRYLDQGSRGAGKGTYNYVVFSDKDVSIIK